MATKPTRMLALAAFEKILKKNGALRISDDALVVFKDIIEERAIQLTQEALRYSRHAGRRTILDSDVRLAIAALEKR